MSEFSAVNQKCKTMQLLPKHIWLLGVVFLLAVSLRLTVVEVMGGAPEKDALQYHSIAVNLISGHGYALQSDVPTAIRPPAYPVFLSLIYSIFGQEYRYALYAQAMMHALLVFPLFWLGFRLSGSAGVGLLSAGLFSIHPSFEIVTRLYAENILFPLLLGFLILMYKANGSGRHRLKYALASGLIIGLMGLTKPEYGTMGLGIMMLALLWSEARRHWKEWLVVVLISMAVLGAWQLRNSSVDSSADMQLANDTLSFANCPAMIGDGWWSVTDIQELERQRALCHSYLDSQSMGEQGMTVRQMWEDRPWMMMKLVVSRVLILWASPPVGISQIASVSLMLKWLTILMQFVFVGLALIAMVRLVVARPELFSFLAVAVYMTIVYGLLHAIRRYGYPFVPELCLMFACGLWMFFEKWKSRKGVG